MKSVLLTLFVILFNINIVFAGGYDCPEIQQYDSCNAGYFMVGNTTSNVYDGTPKVKNDCRECSVLGEGYNCLGGTSAPACKTGYTKVGDQCLADGEEDCVGKTDGAQGGKIKINNGVKDYSGCYKTCTDTENGIKKGKDYKNKEGTSFTGCKAEKNADCNAGYYYKDNDCSECDNGYYCEEGQEKRECPKNSYCPKGATTPIACPDGGYTESDKVSSVKECKKKIYTDTQNNTGKCNKVCLYNDVDEIYICPNDCTEYPDKCIGGYYVNTNSTSGANDVKNCVEVGSGYYSKSDSIKREACPPGTKTTGSGEGADDKNDCGRILHVKGNGKYKKYHLRNIGGRETTNSNKSLRIGINGNTFYIDLEKNTLNINEGLQFNINGEKYYINDNNL